MTVERLALVGAPGRVPAYLLPDEGNAHRHADAPGYGAFRGGPMVEHEHLVAGRIGGYQREIAAGFVPEISERGGAQLGCAHVEPLSNPASNGVARVDN